MCYPVSAHDQTNTSESAKGTSAGSGIGTKLDSIKGAVDALAAAVAAAAAAAVRSSGNSLGKRVFFVWLSSKIMTSVVYFCSKIII